MHYNVSEFYVIRNYWLINEAKPDPYICLEKGTYLIYHDAIHFAQLEISKSNIFCVSLEDIYPHINVQSCTVIIRPLARFCSYEYDLYKTSYIFK